MHSFHHGDFIVSTEPGLDDGETVVLVRHAKKDWSLTITDNGETPMNKQFVFEFRNLSYNVDIYDLSRGGERRNDRKIR